MYLKPLIRRFISDKDLVKQAFQHPNDQELLKFLQHQGVTTEQLKKEIDDYYGITYIDLTTVNIPMDIFRPFNEDALQKQKILPFDQKNNGAEYHFAISDLTRPEMRDEIQRLCQANDILSVKFYFAFDFQIEAKWKALKEQPSSLSRSKNGTLTPDFSAVEWVDSAIRKGIELEASDIHIEPQESGIQVRYRVDGILAFRDFSSYTKEFINTIMTRIKIMSGMDIAEKRKPQDGRVSDFKHENQIYDIRASSVLTNWGEKIVFRLFNKDSEIKSFEELGFTKEEKEQIERLIHSRYGILYLSGATGSGKTTTLYTMIQSINSTEVNTYTIEDPVEKTINNINQIQIDEAAGINYPSTLKALLRQDPDVIVVGEVRDRDTAELSLKASLTGHLVLTTVHANNAIETISRLYNMGIEPYMLSAGILGFVSQRLVRILCPDCKRRAELQPHEKAWIKQIKSKYDLVEENHSFYQPVGCERCNYIGYKGRVAITEIIAASDLIKEMIAQQQKAKTIYETAIQEGFSPIELNAYQKAASGITTIDEIIRNINT